MPVQEQVSKTSTTPENSGDQLFARFQLAAETQSQIEEKQVELERQNAEFTEFYDEKLEAIQTHRRAVFESPDADHQLVRQLREELVESTTALFEQQQSEWLNTIRQTESEIAALTKKADTSYADLDQQLSSLSQVELKTIYSEFLQTIQNSSAVNDAQFRFAAMVSQHISPDLSPLEREYQHYHALRTLELAKKELLLAKNGRTPRSSERDRQRRTHLLKTFVEERLRTLPEAKRQDYILLARKHYQLARDDSATHDIFDRRELAHIELRLPELIPNYEERLIDDRREISEETKQSFTALLREIGDRSLSTLSARLPGSLVNVAILRTRIDTHQQHIVEAAFADLSDGDRTAFVTEAQRRLDAIRLVDFTTWNLDRPIESRFAQLIPGVTQKEATVESEEQAEPLQGDLRTKFDAMISELEKLHRLETVVQGADNTTRRNVAQVYQDAADEIRGMLDRDRLIETEGHPDSVALTELRLRNIPTKPGQDSTVLDESLSGFAKFLETGRLESFRVTEEEYLMRSGKLSDMIEQGASQIYNSLPPIDQFANIIPTVLRVQQSGIQQLTESLIATAKFATKAPTSSQGDMNSLVLPAANTPRLDTPIPEDAPEVIQQLAEVRSTLKAERTEPISSSELYNFCKYNLGPAQSALLGLETSDAPQAVALKTDQLDYDSLTKQAVLEDIETLIIAARRLSPH